MVPISSDKIDSGSVEIIPHLFFPRHLPQCKEKDLNHLEHKILHLVHGAIQSLCEEIEVPIELSPIILKTRKLTSTWIDLQNCLERDENAIRVQKCLKNMKAGDFLAMYITQQNAGLFFSIPKNDHGKKIIVSSFQASCPSHSIMSTEKDLLVQFPELSMITPQTDLLHSQAFSNQLITLTTTELQMALPKSKKAGQEYDESRDVADPMFITEWVTSLLAGTGSRTSTEQEFPRIIKKVRDDVIYKAGKNYPWRRSGLWMTAKAAIQLSLILELGEHLGTFLYKLIILQVLLKAFKQLEIDEDDASQWDLRMQMMAKMARRMEKLKLRYPEKSLEESLKQLTINNKSSPISKMEQSVRHLQTHIFNDIEQGMKAARDEMDSLWKQINKQTAVSEVLVTPEQLSIDTRHVQLKELTDYIETRKKTTQALKNPQSFISFPTTLDRIPQNGNIQLPRSFMKDAKTLSKQSHEIDFLLREVENWIQTKLNCTDTSSPLEIRELIIEYSEIASQHYRNDPLAFSKMILTVLQCVKVLDEIATREFSLLKEYACGVNFKVFENLLIPSAQGMKLAHEIETYFSQRDKNSIFSSTLISENEPKPKSFGVRVAQQNLIMQNYRKAIINKMEKEIQKKKNQVEEVKTEITRLREKSNSYAECSYSYSTNAKRPKKKHRKNCPKCVPRKAADKLDYSVKPYERILPLDEVMQNAIVFDLLIPQSISCLRDLLQFFMVELCSENSEDKNVVIWKEWKDYEHLDLTLQGYTQNKTGRIFFLASTTKLGGESHYAGVANPFVSRDPPESFIVANGMNTRYHNKKPILQQKVRRLSQSCTFVINLKEANFQGMQWAINDATHTSNEAIARQSQCPQGLTIPEFIQFASLRSGNRIQYRNIFLGLSNGMLPIKSEPVFQLLCQAQWQLGPSYVNDWLRDSHQDCNNESFSAELLNLLDHIAEKCKENWSEPYALLSLILITSRTCELTSSQEVRRQTLVLLKKFRQIGSEWMKIIHQVRTEILSESDEKRAELTLKLIDAALACSMTFCFGLTPGEEAEDLVIWLHAISCLYEEVIQDGILNSLTLTRQSILRHVFAEVSTDIEKQVCSGQSPCKMYVYNALSRFLGMRCKDYGEDKVWHWEQDNIFKHYGFYKCKATSQLNSSNHVVHVDLRFGRFLIDGFPIGKLPEAIINHPTYQRVFSKHKFSVQKNGFDTFTTTGDFHNKVYFFRVINSLLIVTELNHQDSTVVELIPHTLFKDHLPHNLEHECSHWWNAQTQDIQFRSLHFKDKEFHGDPKYMLSLNDLRISDAFKKTWLVSRNSPSFICLTSPLQTIEPPNYFNIWVNNNNSIEVVDSLKINLLRLGLQFTLEKGRLLSHEYPESFVSNDQSIGTLVGLGNKLVLSEKSISLLIKPTRKVIVPHGNLKIEVSSLNHQKISVHSEMLRSPRYFVYELDDRMRILKAERNQSAWLYLAALHGATASPLPDPFTGLTGTEMAFEILQSARCWSCQPYDKESLQTLQIIEDFTPSRCFYPSHKKVMQQISWPKGIPSTSAHEGFALIVDKLRRDSTRLSELFSTEKSEESRCISKKSEEELTIKHYTRQIKLSSLSATIKTSFDNKLITRINVPISSTHVRQSLLPDPSEVRRKIRVLSELSQNKNFNLDLHVPQHLLRWIISNQSLQCGRYPTEDKFKDFNLSYWVDVKSWAKKDLSFRHQWLSLYKLAKTVKQTNTLSEWQLLLSGLLMNGEVEVNEVLLLHAVSMVPQNFPLIDFEIGTSFDHPNAEYSSSEIKKIFTQNQLSFSYYGTNGGISDEEQTHRRKVEEESSICEQHVFQYYRLRFSWVSEGLEDSITSIDLHRAQDFVECNLNIWSRNRALKEFLSNVEASILKIKGSGTPLPLPLGLQEIRKPILITGIDLNRFQGYSGLVISEELLQTFTTIVSSGSLQVLTKYLQIPANLARLESALKSLQTNYIKGTLFYVEKYFNPPSTHCLRLSGLYPKSVPTVLLSSFVNDMNGVSRVLVGALGVLWTLEQKIIRCMRYLLAAGDSMKVALDRELQTGFHEGWSPIEYPEWLILELEMDMMIRPMQLATAEEMLNPSGKKNSVMQLNCGEGKTSLIVPMVALAITKNQIDQSSLCRITVLRSIFETNYNSLKYTLGGTLNRKIHTIPCRRDIQIDSEVVEKIQSVLEECVQHKGVLLTVPEHRLSLQLKGYEMSLRQGTKDVQIACGLIKAQQWLNSHARDILDESDELLSAKYQLVYTIGEYHNVDGGDIRWSVAQSLLKLLPKRLQELNEELGDACVEFQNSKSSEIFPSSCRLLNQESYAKLIDKLSDDCLDGFIPEFPKVEKFRSLVKKFLICEGVPADIHVAILEEFKQYERTYEILLLLSGYLKGQVLLKALTKRWRVNYGVDPNGRKRMAVPFRAKDVATERTEFGHADIAIILTQLSYYYSGLSEEQLRECFDRISRRSKCRSTEEIYEEWIEDIPKEKVPLSIRSFSGINLQDFNQWSQHVFPLLSKSMRVIDYWLGSVVFPKECKQYPNKIACTAYDLCPEKALLTTGFSGTNDSRDLLPATIQQIDLQESLNTNKELERILTLPENSTYSIIPLGTRSTSLFRPFKSEGIRVLLDCGALILEFSNDQVAHEWLKADDSIEAVVYFNTNNVLSVKSRTSEDKPFELSPFRKRLNVCAVYLDDEHTRGTDLTLPHGYKACVTLGSGLTKDKLVQACMRMRLLGKGHTVSFWASHEANIKIEDLAAQKSPQVESSMVQKVMEWVKQNSREFLEDGLIYWTAASINYARKVTAERQLVEKGNYSKDHLNLMANQCLEKEVLDLPSMYGEVRTERKFIDVIPEWFQAAKSNTFGEISNSELDKIKPVVVERCTKFIPNRTQFLSQMDEEHEKEIEQEVEEEKEISRPASASPKTPVLSSFVKSLIQCGSPADLRQAARKEKTGVSTLPMSLKCVEKVWNLTASCVDSWGLQIYVTDDFSEAINALYGEQWWKDVKGKKSGDYLRPPAWVVLFGSQTEDQCFLLISPHEANELFHYFRTGSVATTLLMYNPRFLPSQRILIDNPRLSLPSLGTIFQREFALAPLFLFSGSLFFSSEEEQRAMAECLGVDMKKYDITMISQYGDGKVMSIGRSIRSTQQFQTFMKFYTIPAKLIKEILMIRHQGSTPLHSHIARLVFDGMPCEIQQS